MLFVWRGTVSAMACPTLDGLDEQMLGDDLKNLPRTRGLSQIGNLLELGGYLGAFARWRSDVEDGVSDMEIPRAWDDALRCTCRWLWDAAVGTLAQQIRDQSIGELLLIPVGRLAGAPIHTAFGPLPGEADPSDRMLLDYADVTYVPSVTVMDARVAADVRSRSVLAIADPDALAYSGLEANRLVQAVGAGNFLDGALDVGSLRPLLERHPIWHFACHSDVDMARAESGYLLLNGQRVDVDDLLAGMQDKPTLVNLAACATASANTILLTESINLASEFVARGVRCIVASGWPVDDAASCVFMVRYYEALSRAGWNPARAMRETQLWARSATHEDRLDYVRGWKASSIEDAERIEALTLSMETASGNPDT